MMFTRVARRSGVVKILRTCLHPFPQGGDPAKRDLRMHLEIAKLNKLRPYANSNIFLSYP